MKNFNVLVGPNGSGKTNFIEFFKFLKRTLAEVKRRPHTPYLEWWSYRNIVWRGNEELPINVKLYYDIDGFKVEYEASFGGIGGVFRILVERLVIENVLSLERAGNVLRIRHNDQFIHDEIEQIDFVVKNYSEILELMRNRTQKPEDKETPKITSKDLSEQTLGVSSDFTNLLHLRTMMIPPILDRARTGRVVAEMVSESFEPFGVRRPLAILPKKARSLGHILTSIRRAIGGAHILKHPHMKAVKSPSLPRGEDFLLEDSSNLTNVLYRWFSEKQKLPERITTIVSELFPGTSIGFELTFDGRIYLKIYENEVELHPPCIPDGLYKILAILAALELKPSLLAIDELENSLYKEALEYVIDELRNSESTVVVTTHSPLVVDMVKLEDLLITEKTEKGTLLSRVKAPQKLRQKLSELKITQSESWLYGDLVYERKKSHPV